MQSGACVHAVDMAAVRSVCLEDAYSSISGETLQKAIKELKEDPTTRGDLVRELRDRILLKEEEMKVCRLGLVELRQG